MHRRSMYITWIWQCTCQHYFIGVRWILGDLQPEMVLAGALVTWACFMKWYYLMCCKKVISTCKSLCMYSSIPEFNITHTQGQSGVQLLVIQ